MTLSDLLLLYSLLHDFTFVDGIGSLDPLRPAQGMIAIAIVEKWRVENPAP